MRMRAKQMGTIGKGKALRRIREDEEFDLPKGMKPPKWAEPATLPKARKAEPPVPQTLSALARQPVVSPVEDETFPPEGTSDTSLDD